MSQLKKTTHKVTHWKSGRMLVYIIFIVFFVIYYGHNDRDLIKTKINSKIARTPPKCVVTYQSFMSNKRQDVDLGKDERQSYTAGTPICMLTMSTLGPVSFSIYPELTLNVVEALSTDVKAGGYWAPPHCIPRHRVAILVPYSNRERNLGLLLYHIHPFLRKQLLEYRIFVIEQYGLDGLFNKGILYNAGFLESQRFGQWNCLIFHDVDLLPMHERILYSCPRKPTHMSGFVVNYTSGTQKTKMYGGVTAMTPAQFKSVNGFSNYYWNWGGEDNDMFIRLQSRRYPVLRYNTTISRFLHLSHRVNTINENRYHILNSAKRRSWSEGLRTVNYSVIALEKRKLFTRLLIDVNPYNWAITGRK